MGTWERTEPQGPGSWAPFTRKPARQSLPMRNLYGRHRFSFLVHACLLRVRHARTRILEGLTAVTISILNDSSAALYERDGVMMINRTYVRLLLQEEAAMRWTGPEALQVRFCSSLRKQKAEVIISTNLQMSPSEALLRCLFWVQSSVSHRYHKNSRPC